MQSSPNIPPIIALPPDTVRTPGYTASYLPKLVLKDLLGIPDGVGRPSP